MAKNIVICSDGTGNEFGDRNSNVIKLYKMPICDQDQTAYYHPGVGTKYLRINLARRRWIAPGSHVHESVEQRLASPDLKYKPTNLPDVRSPIQDRCGKSSQAPQ